MDYHHNVRKRARALRDPARGAPPRGPLTPPAAPLLPQHPAPAADPQRAFDMHELASQLEAMEAHVYHTAESSATRAAAGGAGGGSSGGGDLASAASAMGLTEGAALALALGPTVDPAVLPIAEGRLFRKEGGLAGRGWKERWVRVEGTALAFYARAGDARPRDVLALAPGMVLVRPAKAHRNRAVKFDFDVALEGADAPVSLYAETEEAGIAWMTSITYMIRRLEDVLHATETGALPGEGAGAGFGAGGAPPAPAEATFSASATAHLGHSFGAAAHPGAPAVLAASLAARDPEAAQRAADAAQAHTAYGAGLFEAVRGEPAAFVVQTNEASGAARGAGGDAVTFSVECLATGLRFEHWALDNGDGTYSCEYTPSRAGPHVLRVLCDGEDVYGSPFFPVVAGAPASASHCALSGDGASFAYAGVVNAVTITAGDAFGEPRSVGGDVFVASVPAHAPALLRGIADHGDGTYTIEYDVDTDHPALAAPRAEGDAPAVVEIAVALANPGFPYPRPVAGSPLRATIVVGPAAAAAHAAAARARAAAAAAARPGALAAGAAAAGAGAGAAPRAAHSPAAAAPPAAPHGKLSVADMERLAAERLAALDEDRRALDEQRAVVQQQVRAGAGGRGSPRQGRAR
jgi:hypothetical protein